MRLRALYWNAAERRFRAPLRVGLMLVVTGLLVAGTSLGAAVGLYPLRTFVAAVAGDPAAAATVRVTTLAVVGGTTALSVLVAGRYVDRRRLRDLGLRIDRDWWLDCGFGLLLGAILPTLVFLVALATGWVRVTGTVQPRHGFAVRFLGVVGSFVVVGVYEELLVRGYLLTNAAEGLAGWTGRRGAAAGAVALSALVFGLAHANNPAATLPSTLAVVLAGVMLGVSYVLTGELGVPVGLHTTWNLFQGGVYGFPVSGFEVGANVLAVEVGGPRVLTGGRFGPEAGLLGVGAILLGTVAVAAWARWRTGDLRVVPGLTDPDLR
jgi:membrane protease YdiL (CAAX protease family)